MTAFHHLALNCHDMAAMERFYSEQFGFQRARTFHRGLPGEFLMLRLGSVCLELFSVPADLAERGGEQAVGFKHMAFEVPDMEAAIIRLQAVGVKTGDIIDAGKNVPGLRLCFFTDPEGNIIELMEGWHDEAAPE